VSLVVFMKTKRCGMSVRSFLRHNRAEFAAMYQKHMIPFYTPTPHTLLFAYGNGVEKRRSGPTSTCAVDQEDSS